MEEDFRWHILFNILQNILNAIFVLLLEFAIMPLWLGIIVGVLCVINLSVLLTRLICVPIKNDKRKDKESE